jgi:menaquinone-specific isochorismate synthase
MAKSAEISQPQDSIQPLTALGADWFHGFLKSGCVLSAGLGRAWVGWGAVEPSAVPVSGRLSVYAPDFLLDAPKPWLLFEQSCEVMAAELAARLEETSRGQELEWSGPELDTFAPAFADVQAKIADGTLLKAVPSVARVSPTPLSPAHRAHSLAKALRLGESFPMLTYGFWTESGDGMIGATPERLFDEAPGRVHTMALAGTRRIGTEGSLLDDPKEMLEHRLVIDGIVARLAPVGRVTVGQTTELSLPTLIHLHTPISVEPAFPVEFEEWVAALHPTPAIGAWPLEQGWAWLRSQPNARSRGRYGAPFGVVPPEGRGRCVVAIRNVQWSASGSEIHAGCGVVGPSKLDREWSEIDSKLDAIQRALGL